jgi:hypothetical protein
LQIFGRLSVPQGTSIFEETCEKCHLPTTTKREQGNYCYNCNCMVGTFTEARIVCKITSASAEVYECTVTGQWILKLLGCELNSFKEFKASRARYLRLFNSAKPEGTFMLNPAVEVIGFRPEVVYLSESISQYINDDALAEIDLQQEVGLLQPSAILIGSISIQLDNIDGPGQYSQNRQDYSPVTPQEDADLDKSLGIQTFVNGLVNIFSIIIKM